jgi:hypothetical protein
MVLFHTKHTVFLVSQAMQCMEATSWRTSLQKQLPPDITQGFLCSVCSRSGGVASAFLRTYMMMDLQTKWKAPKFCTPQRQHCIYWRAGNKN